MTNMQVTVSKSDTMFNAHLSLTTVNDKYASTPFLICTRLGAVNDNHAAY